jgi:putative ABC transport system permease protein
MRDRRAEVRAVTNGIRSFTTTPYVFTQLDRARAYTGTPRSNVTLFACAPQAARRCATRPQRIAVRRHQGRGVNGGRVQQPQPLLLVVRHRRRRRPVCRCSARHGGRLGRGRADFVCKHLYEFATLRAIGSSGTYLHTVIIAQALLCEVLSRDLPAYISPIHISPLLDPLSSFAIPKEPNVDGGRGFPPILLASPVEAWPSPQSSTGYPVS